jgi:hypothetical protein
MPPCDLCKDSTTKQDITAADIHIHPAKVKS